MLETPSTESFWPVLMERLVELAGPLLGMIARWNQQLTGRVPEPFQGAALVFWWACFLSGPVLFLLLLRYAALRDWLMKIPGVRQSRNLKGLIGTFLAGSGLYGFDKFLEPAFGTEIPLPLLTALPLLACPMLLALRIKEGPYRADASGEAEPPPDGLDVLYCYNALVGAELLQSIGGQRSKPGRIRAITSQGGESEPGPTLPDRASDELEVQSVGDWQDNLAAWRDSIKRGRGLHAQAASAKRRLGQRLKGVRPPLKPGDHRALRHFVEVPVRDDAVSARFGALNALATAGGHPAGREADRESHVVWITGPAGAGKSTVVHAVFLQLLVESLQSRDAPPPLLINQGILHSLRQDHGRQPTDFHRQRAGGKMLEAMLRAWVDRLPDAAVRHDEVVERIEHAIVEGDVILLIDGYDELAFIPHSDEILQDVWRCRAESQRLLGIVASRPEALGADDTTYSSDTHIELASRWPIARATKYVTARLGGNEPMARKVFEIVEAGETSRPWLRNPRILELLITTAQGSPERSGDGLGALEEARSEFALLRRLKDFALDRIDPRHRQREAIQELLYHLARQCEVYGSVAVPARESRSKAWRPVLKATDILQVSRAGQATQVSFANANFMHFFQVEPIVAALQANEPLATEYNHQWSESLVGYVADALVSSRDPQPPPLDFLRKNLRYYAMPAGQIDATGGEPERRAVQAANLMQVAVEVLRRLGRPLRFDMNSPMPRIGGGDDRLDLRNLYLVRVDLSGVTIANASLRGTSLKHAKLRRARFLNCDLRDVDLQSANAMACRFEGCWFNFSPGTRRLTVGERGGESALATAVQGALVQGVQVSDCSDPDLDESYNRESFVRNGAREYTTRYFGEFQRLFRDEYEKLVGTDANSATSDYVNRIREALEYMSRREDRPLLVLDLMAGGSNPQLFDLLTSEAVRNVRLVAVDRDTTQLSEFQSAFESPQERETFFHAIKEDLGAESDLPRLLRMALGTNTTPEVDLIIAKKAFHEVGRTAQEHLLRGCAGLLRTGGRLIVYADAPPSMGEYERECLEELRKALVEFSGDASEAPSDRAGAQVPAQVHEVAFSKRVREALTPDPAAEEQPCWGLFANAWALLKDWANENVYEYQRRYFSSQEDIVYWAGRGGSFRELGEPGRYENRLFSSRFNERGLKKVFEYIRAQREHEREPLSAVVKNHWRPGPRISFLKEFTLHYLHDESTGAPTLLGKLVRADDRRIDFGLLHAALEGEFENDVGFSLPIRVFELEKLPGEDDP